MKGTMLVAALVLAAHVAPAQDVEVYDPDHPSKTWHGYLEGNGKRIYAEFRNFGQTEAAPAIRLGHRLRRDGLTSGQAEAECWRAAWMAWPEDRFFARAFAQVAKEAYLGKR